MQLFLSTLEPGLIDMDMVRVAIVLIEVAENNKLGPSNLRHLYSSWRITLVRGDDYLVANGGFEATG